MKGRTAEQGRVSKTRVGEMHQIPSRHTKKNKSNLCARRKHRVGRAHKGCSRRLRRVRVPNRAVGRVNLLDVVAGRGRGGRGLNGFGFRNRRIYFHHHHGLLGGGGGSLGALNVGVDGVLQVSDRNKRLASCHDGQGGFPVMFSWGFWCWRG